MSDAFLFSNTPAIQNPFIFLYNEKTASEIRNARELRMDRSVININVFRLSDFWVFDDPASGIVNEPFVSGMPAILNSALTLITGTNNHKMMDLEFSKDPPAPMTENVVVLFKSHEEKDGCWYWWRDAILEGWLTPYFGKKFKEVFGEEYPDNLYLTIKNISDSYRIVL